MKSWIENGFRLLDSDARRGESELAAAQWPKQRRDCNKNSKNGDDDCEVRVTEDVVGLLLLSSGLLPSSACASSTKSIVSVRRFLRRLHFLGNVSNKKPK
jgi:hypothetical protein